MLFLCVLAKGDRLFSYGSDTSGCVQRPGLRLDLKTAVHVVCCDRTKAKDPLPGFGVALGSSLAQNMHSLGQSQSRKSKRLKLLRPSAPPKPLCQAAKGCQKLLCLQNRAANISEG